MKIERRDSSDERRILIALITNTHVLGKIAAQWESIEFNTKWAQLIAGWCVKYFNKYNKPPKENIENLFRHWAAEKSDKETITLIEKFLDELSGEYSRLGKDINPEHVIDISGPYFNRVKLRKLSDAINDNLDDGDWIKAQEIADKHNRIEIGAGTGIDVLRDKAAVKAAFADRGKPLIVYPGALGNFFGDSLARDSFVAIMAPEKRGKTFWLLDFAWRGMEQQNKVAFFEVGDMSQNQIMKRFMARAAKRPWKPTTDDKPVRYPKFLERLVEEKYATTQMEEREFKHPLKFKTAWNAFQEVAQSHGDQSLLRLVVTPNDTMSVTGMQSVLRTWERQGWVPDIIVCDYADILAPRNGTAETRDQINSTWKGLRSISQSTHSLVITATQSDSASYRAETLDRTNFSEDKRKFAHVTAMLGLNQTVEEKENQVMRLNWLALREDEFIETACVHVAGCLALANPAIKSIF